MNRLLLLFWVSISDFCYGNEDLAFSISEAIKLCVTVVAYAPESYRRFVPCRFQSDSLGIHNMYWYHISYKQMPINTGYMLSNIRYVCMLILPNFLQLDYLDHFSDIFNL